jgi:hypothetical protein
VVAYFDEAIPPDARPQVLGVFSRIESAEVADVLDALGHHPDGATAKAARKAAMQRRTRATEDG